MLRDPRKTLQAVNNCVTVALPLTSIDIDVIVQHVLQTIGDFKIDKLVDVDLETYGLRDGSLLIYSQKNNKWQSSTYLNKQSIDAGEY